MHSRLSAVVIAFGTATLTSIFWLAVAPAPTAGQVAQPAASNRVTRMADGHPNINGLWQAFVTANWDLQDHEAQPGPHPEIMGAYGGGPAGQSIVDGGEIPYKPEALAKKKQNFEKRTT